MTTLRRIWEDLVDRKLWPVAVLLLAALVAVPVLLSKPAPQVSTTAGTIPPTEQGVAGGVPAVSLATDTTTVSKLKGHARDPFAGPKQHLPVPGGPSTSSAAPTPSGSGSGSASGAGSGGGSGSSGGLPTPTEPHPNTGSGSGSGGGGDNGNTGGDGGGGKTGGSGQPKSYTYGTIDVRFSRAGGRARKINALPRLTPLPDPNNPLLVYLGLLGDNKTAVFLVSSDVHPEGDGTCHPSPRDCQTLQLQEGESEFFDLDRAGGGIIQYELDLVALHLHHTTSSEAARAAYVQQAHGMRRAVTRGRKMSRAAKRNVLRSATHGSDSGSSSSATSLSPPSSASAASAPKGSGDGAETQVPLPPTPPTPDS